MQAHCTLQRAGNAAWRVRHSSAELGEVIITTASREDALTRMRNELQYRLELCPCSGESLGVIELQVSEEPTTIGGGRRST